MHTNNSPAATAARANVSATVPTVLLASWKPSRLPARSQTLAVAAAAAVRRQRRQLQAGRPSLMPVRAEPESSSAGGSSTTTAADLQQRLKELDRLLVRAFCSSAVDAITACMPSALALTSADCGRDSLKGMKGGIKEVNKKEKGAQLPEAHAPAAAWIAGSTFSGRVEQPRRDHRSSPILQAADGPEAEGEATRLAAFLAEQGLLSFGKAQQVGRGERCRWQSGRHRVSPPFPHARHGHLCSPPGSGPRPCLAAEPPAKQTASPAPARPAGAQAHILACGAAAEQDPAGAVPGAQRQHAQRRAQPAAGRLPGGAHRSVLWACGGPDADCAGAWGGPGLMCGCGCGGLCG